MPLIIKGNKDVNIVSKEEIARKVEEEKTKLTPEEAALAKLPAEVAERRREILEAKKHRDYMAKIAKLEEAAKLRIQEEKDVEAEVQVTEEIVVETGPDPIIIKHNDDVKVSETVVEKEIPDFEKMTKKELDEWAEETLGLTLDRRKKKADLIEIIKNNL